MEKHDRFLDLYHAGRVRAAQIDDYVNRWHEGQLTGPDSHVSLHVYLGMTWSEYTAWATNLSLPSREEHERVPQTDLVFVTLKGEPLVAVDPLHVHGPTRCRPTCPIHWPSEHLLVDSALGWDPDQGLITRICAHGWHHPDPDDQQVRLHAELAEHRCDNCCRSVTIDGELAGGRPRAAIEALGADGRLE